MRQAVHDLPGISAAQSRAMREKAASWGKLLGNARYLKALGIGAGSLLGLTAAQSGAGHIANALSDPTYGKSPEEAFSYNQTRFDDMARPIVSDLNDAIAAEDWSKADSLRKQLADGNFGGSNWAHRWISPWTASPNASLYANAALRNQRTLQNEYDEAMQKHIGTPAKMQQSMQSIQSQLQNPSMMPIQRTALERQLAQMRQRFQHGMLAESPAAAAIKERMTGSGMNVRPFNRSQNMPGQYGQPGQGYGQPGVFQGSHPWGGVPAGPVTMPNPATMGLNAGISPTSLNTNQWSLDNAVQRWAMRGGNNGQVARPNV